MLSDTAAEQGGMSDGGKGQRGIQSIEVGGELLHALVRHGRPMTLGHLAREAGFTAAKAHPYLVSFGKLGLVEQDGVSGRYGLGPFALQMGLTALHEQEPLRVATPLAAQLADELRLNVAMAVWGDRGPTVVRIEETNARLHLNMRPGTVMMPLMGSATARVFAAFLPERMTAALLAEEAAPDMAETLAEIRRRGLSRALGSPIPGINAFSAPVFNSTGFLTMALTAMGAEGTFDTAWDGPVATKLKACAEGLSARLGNRPARAAE